MPGVEENCQMAMAFRLLVQKTLHNLFSREPAEFLISAKHRLLGLIIGNLRQQALAKRIGRIGQNRFGIVTKPSLMKAYQVTHQADEYQIGGTACRLPNSQSPAIVLGVEVLERMQATAREEDFARTSRVGAVERLIEVTSKLSFGFCFNASATHSVMGS